MNKFIVLLAFSSLSLFGQEIWQEIDWVPLEGNPLYVVEISQDQEELLYSIETEAPPLQINLPAGEYYFRIIVLNKFGNRISETEWQSLVVQRALQPQIVSVNPNETYEGTEISGTAEILQLEEDALIVIFLEDQRYALEYQISAENRIHFTAQGNFTPGFWNLYIINPSGKEDTFNNALEVQPYLYPVISGVDRALVPHGAQVQTIEVWGSDFDSGAEIKLIGLETYNPLSVVFQSPESLQIRVISAEFPPGSYDIEVSNSNGEKFKLESAIQLEEPIKVAEEIQREINSVLSAQLNYMQHYPLNEAAQYLDPSLPSFGVALRQGFSNNVGLTKDIGLTGMEFGFNYLRFPYLLIEGLYLTELSVYAGIYYMTDFPFFLNLGLSVDGGMTYSLMDLEDGDINTSLDFFWMGRAFLHFELMDRFYLEPGYHYSSVFYVPDPMDHHGFTISGGIWIR